MFCSVASTRAVALEPHVPDDADPFGVHLYHCHANPLKRHVHKGLYGAFIVDPPAETPRPPADELVMVLNAFDTNFDAEEDVFYLVRLRGGGYANALRKPYRRWRRSAGEWPPLARALRALCTVARG